MPYSLKDKKLSAVKITDGIDCCKAIVFKSINSTNTYAKQLASGGAGNMTVVVSESQTAGRGRMGRSFYSDSKGIYMSVILRTKHPISKTPLITLFAAVTVAKAIEKLIGINIDIKWVNDLLLNGKKICGILTESEVRQDNIDYAVVGIGINTAAFKLPDELVGIASSIEAETGIRIDRNRLINEILKGFSNIDSQMESLRFMKEYRTRSIVIGKKITLLRNGGETVEVVAIDDEGGLVVTTPHGQETLKSGEISIRIPEQQEKEGK